MADVDRPAGWVPDDATLEYAARLIEETDFSDMRGCLADTTSGQLEFAIRFETREETRKEAARHIRAMMARPDLDAPSVLRRIVEHIEKRPAYQSDALLPDAWPLAWKGWLTIEARIKVNSNHVPPECHYHIELTDKGRAMLREEVDAEDDD